MSFSKIALFLLIAVVAAGVAIVACSGGDDDDDDNGGSSDKELQFQHDHTWTCAPSLVAVSFSVETADGDPAVGLYNTNFEILENGEPVSDYESHQNIIPVQKGFRLATLLLLDLSSSVQDKVFQLKAGAKAFIQGLPATQDIAIYYFRGDEEIFEIQHFTSDKTTLNAAIDTLENHMMDASTNLYGAFVEGLDVLETQESSASNQGKSFQGSLVVFTDGKDRANIVDKSTALSAVNNSPHSVFTMGVGSEIDQDELAEFGKDGFLWAENSNQLESEFQNMAETIERENSKYYILAYCSPIRSGNAEITIQGGKGAYFGSFSTTYSAEGFEDGCGEDDVNNFDPGSLGDPIDDDMTDDDVVDDDTDDDATDDDAPDIPHGNFGVNCLDCHPEAHDGEFPPETPDAECLVCHFYPSDATTI